MSKDREFSRATNITDGLDLMHDAAMSGGEVRSAEGRIGKDLINVLTASMDREIERGTHPATILLATQSAVISSYFTVLLNVIPPHGAAAVAEHMRQGFVDHFDRALAEVRKRPTVGEP